MRNLAYGTAQIEMRGYALGEVLRWLFLLASANRAPSVVSRKGQLRPHLFRGQFGGSPNSPGVPVPEMVELIPNRFASPVCWSKVDSNCRSRSFHRKPRNDACLQSQRRFPPRSDAELRHSGDGLVSSCDPDVFSGRHRNWWESASSRETSGTEGSNPLCSSKQALRTSDPRGRRR